MKMTTIMKNKINFTIALLLASIAAFAQSPHAAQLYGMTQYGGPDHKGSIFHFTPSTQTVTVDYNFQIKVKGKNPKCDIVTDNNGKYYGTTTRGGTNDFGVLFSWDSISSVYVELYNFTGIDGNDARGAMQLYNGKFYGMTNSGGANNAGVIYEWDIAANTYTKKYDMDSTNGSNPDGSLTLVGNLFYGFTHNGGANNVGVLFSWNPLSNVYTKLYDCTTANGANPVGKLVPFNSKLYGMTNLGGTLNHGVIYEWNYTTNVYTKKHDFDSINGQHPMGFLTLYNNKFYGLTYDGGIYETPSLYDHYGVIFEWNPSTNSFLNKRNLGALNGNVQTSHGPLSSLTLKGNIFYGISSEGGARRTAIFSWNPATNVYTDLYWNSSSLTYCEGSRWAPGLNAYGSLLLSGNKLLGSFALGGGEDVGTISEYYPDSNQITRSVHMGAADAAYPRASLSKFGKKLVGVSYNGGRNHQGNIFEWDWDTQIFTERFEMTGYNTGIFPMSTLSFLNGKFYGFNTYGKSIYGNLGSTFGTRYYQDFFSWDPVSNIYQSYPNLIPTSSPVSFTTANNRLVMPLPQTTLLTPPNTSSYISVLQYDPTNSTLNDSIKIHGGSAFVCYQNLISANGLIYNNGKYYGMSVGSFGPSGFESIGTIFEWDTTLTHGVLRLSFSDSTTGSYPTGDLVFVDSVFYGLTTGISTYIAGLFKWNPVTNTATLLSYYSGYGTPTYSNGKLYWLAGSIDQKVVEYDIVLETILEYNLPTYPGNTPVLYEWINSNCPNLSYPKLVEVIPNKDPVLSNVPDTQSICSNQNHTATFTLSDLDNDTMSFQISSSDTNLISLQNISISNVDTTYTITYSSVNNQTGVSTLSFIADDGYGGLVNFSFLVNVIASPSTAVTQNSATLSANQNGATYQWIDCNNNSAIAGATNQSFTASTSGNYAVAVTINNCTDTSACVSGAPVGIDEIVFQNQILIHPNPAHDEIQISITKNTSEQIYSVALINTIGQVLIEEKQIINPINTSVLSNGIYFINIQTDKAFYKTKFIKQ
jgi:uncharacterized repeat protein (TIGR03803 family)